MAFSAATLLRLAGKELLSLRADPVLLGLIVYVFTIGIYAVATGAKFEVTNAAVAIVDEDRSPLSRHLAGAILPPQFKPPVEIPPAEADLALERGDVVFVVSFPARMEADLLSGRGAVVQIAVDATAMTQAGNGAVYLQSILSQEAAEWLRDRGRAQPTAVSAVVRAMFNPNLDFAWFSSVMQVINNITMLAVILTGAALIREREHGTLDHLLVMPVSALEIMLSKVLANGLVILAAALLSLQVVIRGFLGIPVAGSIWFFAAGAGLYLFSVTALGILMATFTRSMPQFALLVMPVLVVMNLLSGASTPIDSMPEPLQIAMQATPAPHFVRFAQAVLYRGAGPEIAAPDLAALALLGLVYVALSAARFRQSLVSPEN